MPYEKPELDYSKLIAEKINSLFPSNDLRRAANNINSLSLDQKIAIEHKQDIAIEVREQLLLDEKKLIEGAVVYVASGTDIAYPLSLGARHIIMVDPIFANNKNKEKVTEIINSITDEQPREATIGLEFAFDFGHGDETVRVEFYPEIYGSEETYEHVAPSAETDEKNRLAYIAELEAYEKDGTLDKIIAGEDIPGEMLILIQPEIAQRFKNREGTFAPNYTPPDDHKRPARFRMDKPITMLLGFRTTGIKLFDDQNVTENLAEGGYVLTDQREECDDSKFERLSMKHAILFKKNKIN